MYRILSHIYVQYNIHFGSVGPQVEWIRNAKQLRGRPTEELSPFCSRIENAIWLNGCFMFEVVWMFEATNNHSTYFSEAWKYYNYYYASFAVYILLREYENVRLSLERRTHISRELCTPLDAIVY